MAYAYVGDVGVNTQSLLTFCRGGSMASFYVRKSGVKGWVAYIQLYSEGKKTQRALTPEEYGVHCLNREWTLTQARHEIQKLNKLNKVETRKKSIAAQKVNLLKIETSIYVDAALAATYQQHLIDNDLEGDEERALESRVLFHWRSAQTIINRVRVMPEQYHKNSGKFIQEFLRQEFSHDYVTKLLRVINGFGEFCAEHRNSFFKPIQFSRNQFHKIRDKYINSDKYRGPSDGLSPAMLERQKSQLKIEQYQWLFISVWFGLRPHEIDSLSHPKFGHRIEWDPKHKKRILCVYQSKLRSVGEEKRWKYIPVLFKEQETALKYLSLDLERPLNKTLKKLFGKNTRGYAGRKAFTDLMLEKGRKIEEISSWLGHSSIETTWKFYKDKNKVTLLEAG